MKPMLSKQLQEQIEQEAKAYANQFKYGAEYRKPAFADGANGYAALYETALARAERAEKALRLIEQMSDPGDYWLAVCRMKSIASDALTPKTGSDEG